MLFRSEALALALKALIVTGAIATLPALFSLTFLPEVLSFVRSLGWIDIPYPGFRPRDILKPYAALTVLMAPVLVWGGWRLGGHWRSLAAVTVIGLFGVVLLTNNRSAIAGLLAIAVVGAGLMMCVRRNLAVNMAVGVVLFSIILAVLLWLHDTRLTLPLPPISDGIVTILPRWLIDYQRQTIWVHAIDIGMQIGRAHV